MTDLSSLAKMRYSTMLAALFLGLASVSHFALGTIFEITFTALALVMLGLTFYFNMRVGRTLSHASEVCFALGRGDMEKRTEEVRDKGEMRNLLVAINYSADKFDTFMREAVASTNAMAKNRYYRRIQLGGMSGVFFTYANQINDTVGSVEERIDEFDVKTSHFEEATQRIAENLSEAGTQMNSTAAQMSDSAADTNERSAVVATASQETSANVQTVSAAVEELSASAREIGSQIARSAEIAAQAVNQTKEGEEKINSLSKAADTIGHVVELISAIAEQTNLLALNATIEAARAGEAGKGFAVVAGEVKELAGQTGKAIGEITTQIQEIQTATKQAVAAFGSVTTTISEIEAITSSVATATDEQNGATSEIARSVEEAYAGTEQVANNINDVSRIAEETGRASGVVMHSAERMNGDAMTLKKEVEDFIYSLRTGPLDRNETGQGQRRTA